MEHQIYQNALASILKQEQYHPEHFYSSMIIDLHKLIKKGIHT